MTRPDLRSISDVASLVRAGALSPLDLVRVCLDRIAARREVNAFITVMAEEAVRDA